VGVFFPPHWLQVKKAIPVSTRRLLRSSHIVSAGE